MLPHFLDLTTSILQKGLFMQFAQLLERFSAVLRRSSCLIHHAACALMPLSLVNFAQMRGFRFKVR